MNKNQLINLLGEEGLGVYKHLIDSVPTKRVNNKRDLKDLYLSSLNRVLNELNIKIDTSRIRLNTLDSVYKYSCFF